jgi:hypothetical protein
MFQDLCMLLSLVPMQAARLTCLHWCRNYLEKSGKQLREQVERLGGQLVVELRRNHEPEIRACYCALPGHLHTLR